jgi:hypothetical protein
MRIILLIQMRSIVIAKSAAIMALLVSIAAFNSTFAIKDNNTDTSTRRGNDNSSVVVSDGSSDNGESAKSGSNTTVCGSDAAHACKMSSGGQ